MHKIIVLWATPRSTSTTFEWMMRMRGDLNCLHEPFGDQTLWPRWTPDSPSKPGLTFHSVMQKLRSAAEEKPVFSRTWLTLPITAGRTSLSRLLSTPS